MNTKDVFQNFALVCKRFRTLTLDASALKSITLKNTSRLSFKSMENLKKVLQRSKKLQKLELSEDDRSFDITAIFKCCIEFCPQLNALTLTGYGLLNSSLRYNSSFTRKTNFHHLRLSVDFPFESTASKFINLRTLTIDVIRYGNGFMKQLY